MERSDLSLQRKLDNNGYDANFLFEVKTPLNLPYFTGSSSYEPAEGSIEIGGEYYNYVKRKVHRDTLYILCIANPSKTALAAASTRFSEQLGDFTDGKKPANTSFKKVNFLSEYNEPVRILIHRLPSVVLSDQTFILPSLLVERDPDASFRPPRQHYI